MGKKAKRSKQVLLKLPRSYQRQAARMAARDGVTVEEWMIAAIAEYVGAVKEVETVVVIQMTASTAQRDTPARREDSTS